MTAMKQWKIDVAGHIDVAPFIEAKSNEFSRMERTPMNNNNTNNNNAWHSEMALMLQNAYRVSASAHIKPYQSLSSVTLKMRVKRAECQ